MIRRAGQAINADLELDPNPMLPEISGFDLDLSIDNVVGFGGDAARYRHFMARGLAGLESDLSSAHILAVASLAAWRAGVLELRSDALGRMTVAPAASVAGALGIESGALEAFAHGQSGSRFAWPGSARPRRVIALVGGFRGLGGAFASPPLSTALLEREGGFAIRTATEHWEYDADIFGGRLSRVDTPGPIGELSGAELLVTPDSYLATLALIA